MYLAIDDNKKLLKNNFVTKGRRNIIPAENLHELRQGFNRERKQVLYVLNEGLFLDLYLFSIERLKVFYEDFKESDEDFEKLKNGIVEEEVLMEVLKRYDMVSV